jgi:NitT/TauT family transport system ATP-binding protein
MSAPLRVRGLVKEFPKGRRGCVRVLDNIDFEVAAGEFVCVVGVNGSGKSTLLSLIAGLLQPTSGRLNLNGSPITGPGPDRGLVFQAPSLYPWRTVERNVAFGLELLGVPRLERRARVSWYLEVMGLTPFTQSLPKQLSGGQRQRATIARALACEPKLLLLDEPFGALDVQTKEDMQVFLRQVWTRTGTTVIMVTHDVEEAVYLAQRVYVMAARPGRIAEEVAIPFGRNRGLPPGGTPASSTWGKSWPTASADSTAPAGVRSAAWRVDGPVGLVGLVDRARRAGPAPPECPQDHPGAPAEEAGHRVGEDPRFTLDDAEPHPGIVPHPRFDPGVRCPPCRDVIRSG